MRNMIRVFSKFIIVSLLLFFVLPDFAMAAEVQLVVPNLTQGVHKWRVRTKNADGKYGDWSSYIKN